MEAIVGVRYTASVNSEGYLSAFNRRKEIEKSYVDTTVIFDQKKETQT